MANFKLTLSYDGSDFFGWQTQPNKRTVQETLEKAISELTGEERIRLNASGRTDSGVHAVAQVANFLSDTEYSPEVLQNAINARMPEDVVITSIGKVSPSFDANRDAKTKLYRYVIHNGQVPNPFMRKYCCYIRKPLDPGAMKKASRSLLGTHDFHSFETEWPNRASSVRTITYLVLNRVGEWIWLDVEADGFLYNMVRAIAGTLINVGRGYWPPEQVGEILEAKDRTQAGPTAAAQGLYLMRVSYD